MIYTISMRYYLYNSLKSQLRTDRHEWFYDTFLIYIRNSNLKSFLLRAYYYLGKIYLIKFFINILFAFLSSCRFSIKSFHSKILISYINESEKSEFNKLNNQKLVDSNSFILKEMKNIFSFENLIFLFCLLKKLKKIYRIARTYQNDNELLNLRATELLFLFIKFDIQLTGKNSQIRHILIGTISSPYALALHAIAKKYGLKYTLIDHGFYINDHIKLHFENVLFSSQFSKRLFLSVGNKVDRAVIKPFQRHPIKFNDKEHVLALLPKIYNKKFVQELDEYEKFSIRYHPQDLFGVRLRQEGLAQQLDKCWLTVSGSSSVLIESLLLGRPSAYLAGIDIVKQEGYEFVKMGLVYELNSIEEIDREKIVSFYDSSEYVEKLKELFENDISHEDYQKVLISLFSED